MFNKGRSLVFAAFLLSAGILAGCGKAGGRSPTIVGEVTCPDGTKLSGKDKHCAAAASNTAPSTPGPTVTVTSGAEIPDNFDASVGLEPVPLAPDNGDDPLGAFRFFCTPGQVLYDDPIVNPGQPGRSNHLHQFIGNTAANGNSTYQSLRERGGSTCDNRGQPYALNRSSYWMPAMLDGLGNVVQPVNVLVYYKRLPANDPRCRNAPGPNSVGICTDMPAGIRFIFGYDMATMRGGPLDTDSWDQWAMNWACIEPNGLNNIGPSAKTIGEVASRCPVGKYLKASFDGPTCWDGKNLDVADHRSHVVYASGAPVSGVGRQCPATHPYVLPVLGYQWFFMVDETVKGWRLASDDMMAQMMGRPVAAGSTMHMDYFEAWSPMARKAFHAACIDKHLSCNNGDLGDGRQMKSAGIPPGGWSTPSKVPIPPRP